MRYFGLIIGVGLGTVGGCASPTSQTGPFDAEDRSRAVSPLSEPAAGNTALSITGAGELRLHFIDVGQGDCTLLECPNGGTLLIDCGSLGGGDWESARGYILDHLSEDAPRIDTLVITHPDADHYNLLERVLEDVAVGAILLTGTHDEYSANGFEAWLDEQQANQTPIRRLTVDDFDAQEGLPRYIGCGDADVRLLAADVSATESPTNARSIVLLVSHQYFDVLLTGDATFATEEMILSRYDHAWLNCEVLKIGHHGSSTTSTSDAWVNVIKPEAAVASASYRNRFGHPRKVVIERLTPHTLQEAGHLMRWGWWENRRAVYENVDDFDEAVYSTAVNGTIVVTSDGSEYWIEYETRVRSSRHR